MNEFLNRVNTQRQILQIVNKKLSNFEPLYSLSDKAIRHWADINDQAHSSELISLLSKLSDKLFFLANKSQEQVTNDYLELSREVQTLINKLNNILNN